MSDFYPRLNEQFDKFGDPVQDMGIGRYGFWYNLRKQVDPMDAEDFRDTFFPKTTSFRFNPSYLVYAVLDEIIENKITPEQHQEAFERALDVEKWGRGAASPENWRDLRRVVNLMRDKFHLNVEVPQRLRWDIILGGRNK